jgi:hypothetical protein
MTEFHSGKCYSIELNLLNVIWVNVILLNAMDFCAIFLNLFLSFFEKAFSLMLLSRVSYFLMSLCGVSLF